MHRWEIATDRGDEAACYALRAAEYARYYRNVPADRFTDELDVATDPDGGELSHVIAAWEGDVLVGTIRLLRSRDPRYPGLRSEVADLMDLDWAELAHAVGVPPGGLRAGEVGKFAVAACRDTRRAKWATVTAAGAVATRLGLHVVLAVMPPAVERSVQHAGVRFRRLEGVRLRRGCPDKKRLLLRYSDYFLPALRRMGLDIDADRLASASPVALDMLLAGSADGPALWWITPAEMAASPFPGPVAGGGEP